MMIKLQIGIVPVTSFQQNCALLWNADNKQGVVVDPGGDVPNILSAIDETGIEVTQILLTHGHLDHVGGAMALKKELNVEIMGPHLEDKPICESVEEVAARYGLPDKLENCTPDAWLAEGDVVTIGGAGFDVYHCPGHSPGHVIFHSPQHHFVHAGDVLFKGSVGRTDLPGGDHDQLISSIKNKLLLLGDDTNFLCGHGPGGTLGEERRTNPFLQ